MSATSPTAHTVATQASKKRSGKKKKPTKQRTPDGHQDTGGSSQQRTQDLATEPPSQSNSAISSPKISIDNKPLQDANGHARYWDLDASNGQVVQSIDVRAPSPIVDESSTTEDADSVVSTTRKSSLVPNSSNEDKDGSSAVTGFELERAPLETDHAPLDREESNAQNLRRLLELERKSHAEVLGQLRAEVEEGVTAREVAEEQYQTLLKRVEKIRESLADRLQHDKQELEQTKGRVDELERENERLRINDRQSADQIISFKAEAQDASRELASLRSRHNLSTQNWLKEKDDMSRLIQRLKGEVSTTSTTMAEWQVIAMEERTVKESITERALELDAELIDIRTSHKAVMTEHNQLSSVVDGLQKDFRDLREGEWALREVVESSHAEIKTLRELVRRADSQAAEAESCRASLDAELQRMAPFEKEIKEKNLLIGKLRHEAIVLNDHLTKALRYLKRTRPEDNVDKHVVTNHFLHFLTTDRSDPKRFQILQVIAGYLGWTDEHREQAGLARPGASGLALRLPVSPFHRTPSTPSLNTEFFSDANTPASAARESLAGLWAEFLQRSVDETDESAAQPLRHHSLSTASSSTPRSNA